MKNESTERKRKYTKFDIDRMLAEAVDSGVVSGRLLGLVEAYEFLVKSGFKQSAKMLKQSAKMLKQRIETASPSLPEAKA